MLILALTLALAQSPPSPPPPTAPDPTPVVLDDAGQKLVGLQTLYDQSCGQRAYAAYDDLCEQLAHQIRDYQREQARAPSPKPR